MSNMEKDFAASSGTQNSREPRAAHRLSMQLDGGNPSDSRYDVDIPLSQSPTVQEPLQQIQHQHQRFALADPVAFRYLAEDPSTTVLERKRELQGYQCYLIEQWACSRRDPTFIIAEHTGNPEHKIKVAVLSVPGNEEKWSPELKMYFKALTKLHARRRDTPAGSLMVTNLSGFPSSLTLVHVPDGDPQAHREIFFVNEDLKRLGCSGRAGLTVAEPSTPTRAKFYQLYKVSEKIPFFSSIIELVKLCQAALMLFGQLEPEYADGLLCDVTERAINDWWAETGTSLYNVEPNDGILGPTSVAAIIGTLMGARSRLSVLGAPVTKDVFDLEETKRSISWFQKAYRITPRTRRLDRQTLDRLHKITLKQASGDSWTMPSAVKSTVAELTGKAGEMVMDIAGRADKVTIADVETVDYDRFVQLVKGDRARWLWHGKSRKRTTRDAFSETLGPEIAAFRDDRVKDKQSPDITTGVVRKELHRPRASYDDNDETQQEMRTSLDFPEDGEKRRSNVINKAKDKIKGVRYRRHGHGNSQDDHMPYSNATYNRSIDSIDSADAGTHAPFSTEHHEGRISGFLERRKETLKIHRKHSPRSSKDKDANGLSNAYDSKRASIDPDQYLELRSSLPFEFGEEILPATSINTLGRSMAENYQPLSEVPVDDIDRIDNEIGFHLRHRHSFSEYETRTLSLIRPHEQHWPRHLSFSIVESPLTHLQRNDISPPDDPNGSDYPYPNAKRDLQHELCLAFSLCQQRQSICSLQHAHLPWVDVSVSEVAALHLMAAQDIEQMQTLYEPRREDFNALRDATTALTEQERHQLEEAVREVEEAVKKAEYEVRVLESKVEDAEGAIRDFERQVGYVEGRVAELVKGGVATWRKEGILKGVYGWAFGLFLRSTHGNVGGRKED